MSGPSTDAGSVAGQVRPPAFAGLFYPDDADACRQLARHYVAAGNLAANRAAANRAAADTDAAGEGAAGLSRTSRRRWFGGIVPHAGWICSGAIAGQTIGSIAEDLDRTPDVVVVFAAVHTPAPMERATLDTFQRWFVPDQASEVSPELRATLIEQNGDLFCMDDRFHSREHAVEVELPLIQAAWHRTAQDAPSILPVEVPLIDEAPKVGIETARRITAMGLRAVFLASSDLTHYGPSYGFMPAGIGVAGLAWATANDRRLLERIEAMEVDRIVGTVRDARNACGGGAIAAMLAACRDLGATQATVLRHSNSDQVLREQGVSHDRENAVGYASVVVG